MANKRLALARTKKDAELQLVKLKEEMNGRGWHSREQWNELNRTKIRLIQTIAECETDLSEVKASMALLHEEMYCPSSDQSHKAAAEKRRVSIEILREKYQQFSSDPTRVASMRLMASEFVQELDRILTMNVHRDAQEQS
jgi:hypothetical protein